MKATVKSLIVGILLMLILSIPLGFVLTIIQGYFLEINGLSYDSSDIEVIASTLNKYGYHPYMLAFYLGSKLITVAFPSYVAARIAEQRKLLHGLAIGLIAAVIYLLDFSIYDDVIFIALNVALNILAGYLGGYLAKIKDRPVDP